MKSVIKVIISGGGTGGHIFPAIATANELKRQLPEVKILFVGAKGRMEMKLVAEAGYPIEGIKVRGLERKISLKNLIANLKLPFIYWRSLQAAKQILSDFSPDIVIGVGGYVSAPILKAAAKRKIPTLIEEQNSYPGITNKILSKVVDKICVAYDGMERFFPMQKIVKTGNPIRKDIIEIQIEKSIALQHFSLQTGKKTVAVIGGSLGAENINNTVKKLIDTLIVNNIQLIWQTGEAYYSCLDETIKNQQGICVLPFVKRMDLLYAAADVVVSRAGALTISELCVAGKPCILIPSPNVTEDHQTKNARSIADLNAGILLPDAEVYTKLDSILLELLSNNEKMNFMYKKLQEIALPNAAEKIVEEIIKLTYQNE